jgi:hypothetical protein
MNKKIMLVAVNLLSLLLVLIVNGLANVLPIGGLTTGEISDMYPNYFTPAGFTFSIWGVIYLFLILFVLYQIVHYIRHQKLPAEVDRIGFLFLFTNLMNASWIVAWHYLLIPLSFGIMLLLLVSLILIYRRLNAGAGNGAETTMSFKQWSLYVPFSLYLGWISAATIANLTILLIHFNFDSMSSAGMLWAAAMVIVAALIGMAVLLRKQDFIYAGVISWTLVGIIAARTMSDESAVPVVISSGIALSALVIAALYVTRAKKGQTTH